MDRTIHFGDDEADARYRIQDTSSTGGDLVLAEDLDGGTVLLEYDYSASEWVSRGPVNLSGNDITNAGSISADALEADTAETNSQTIVEAKLTTNPGVISSGNYTAFVDTATKDTNDEFGADVFNPSTDGYYSIIANVNFASGGTQDKIRLRLQDKTNGSTVKNSDFAPIDCTNFAGGQLTTYVYLNSGVDYQLQTTNFTSSFEINDDESLTNATIVRGIVQ